MRRKIDTCLGRDLAAATKAPTSSSRFMGFCNTAKRGFNLSDERTVRMSMRMALAAAAVLMAHAARAAELPEVSEEAVAALGSTAGSPQVRGFVFVDGKYLPPPYMVTRRGNGIFINRIQVAQPVPWASAQPGEPKKALDDDGDFEVVQPDEKKDAEEKAAEEKPAVDKDELLFGDADDAKEKGKEEAHAIDALFDDVGPAKKKTPEKKPLPPQPSNAAPSKQQVEELKAKLDALRKGYETKLGQGDIYFFSQRHSLVHGSYGAGKELFAVLPSALRYAQSPQDLMAKLNQGGVYFLDVTACADLYKNRMSFMQLDERRKQIEAEEAAKRSTGGRAR